MVGISPRTEPPKLGRCHLLVPDDIHTGFISYSRHETESQTQTFTSFLRLQLPVAEERVSKCMKVLHSSKVLDTLGRLGMVWFHNVYCTWHIRKPEKVAICRPLCINLSAG